MERAPLVLLNNLNGLLKMTVQAIGGSQFELLMDFG
jgi:hypothetical protein